MPVTERFVHPGPARGFPDLARLYSPLAPVIGRGGLPYPAAAVPMPLRDPRNLVIAEEKTPPLDPVLRKGGEPHLAALRKSDVALHNGAVLVLTSLEDGVLRAAPSTYFANVATADALRHEYVERGIGPLRERAHACAEGDPLRSGEGRAAAIGVTVAVTVPSAAGRALLVGRRRDDLAADPGLWDVGPSGTLEPETAGDPLLLAAARELAEELPLLQVTGAQMKVLGVGFDLLRLRPEVILRLDLTEKAALPPEDALDQSEYVESQLIDLTTQDLEQFWSSRNPLNITPSGVAAVALLEATM